MNFYQRIKWLRESKELSQEFVAEKIGIDRKTYNRLENQVHEAKLSVIIALASFYRVSIDYLVGMTDDPKPPKSILYQTSKNITINTKGNNNNINVKN